MKVGRHMDHWPNSMTDGYQECAHCARVRRDQDREMMAADLYDQLTALTRATEEVIGWFDRYIEDA